MIYNSWAWKGELKRKVSLLRKLLSTRERYSSKLTDELELFLVQSAFSVRKIRDSNKLSDKAEKYKVWVESSPLVDQSLFLKGSG